MRFDTSFENVEKPLREFVPHLSRGVFYRVIWSVLFFGFLGAGLADGEGTLKVFLLGLIFSPTLWVVWSGVVWSVRLSPQARQASEREKNRLWFTHLCNRLAPVLSIFIFLLVIVLADCMNLSLIFGVQLGLLMMPIFYLMVVYIPLFWKGLADITNSTQVYPVGWAVKRIDFPLFPASVVLPHPVSPPRLSLADHGAAQPQG